MKQKQRDHLDVLIMLLVSNVRIIPKNKRGFLVSIIAEMNF